jgi:hypothetical protein
MDPKRDGGGMLLAPGASSRAPAASFPSHDRRPPSPSTFPPVDEHLVKPEVSREEIIRGRKIVTMGANPPHAETNSRLDFIVVPHVREGYVAATDLLIRAAEQSNFATDCCVRKQGIDPKTGSRYLEELSFEIVNQQSMRNVTEKAEDLTHRGVRRFFAIFVKTNEIGEWSPSKGEFVRMSIDGMLEDPLLIRPIAVRALVDAALAENEVALALLKKGNPALRQIIEKERDKGHDAGLREMLVDLLQSRFETLPAHIHARIQRADANALKAWAKKSLSASSVDELFRDE